MAAASSCPVMSREIDSKRVIRPSLSRIGVITTSHHLGVPFAVGQYSVKRAFSPSNA